MAYPDGIGVVDLMIGFPIRDRKGVYDRLLKPGLKDRESRQEFEFPAEYMFKDVPGEADDEHDPIDVAFAEMDRFGVEVGLFGMSPDALTAKARDPKRVQLSLEVNPNDVMGAIRKIRAAKSEHDLKAVTFFPAGPRFPSDCQHVMRFDRVCYDFPELRIVMRHGAEPWEDLAVKLMLKWPGLSYMTSAFAPKYYPTAIIDYANTRGADKIMYAGYYPMGLSLERIFSELPQVPFRDHVWPKFLRDNARSVFALDGS